MSSDIRFKDSLSWVDMQFNTADVSSFCQGTVNNSDCFVVKIALCG